MKVVTHHCLDLLHILPAQSTTLVAVIEIIISRNSELELWLEKPIMFME